MEDFMFHAFLNAPAYLAFAALATILGFCMDALGLRTHLFGRIKKSAADGVSIVIAHPKTSLIAVGTGLAGAAVFGEMAADHHDVAATIGTTVADHHIDMVAGLADMPTIDMADLPLVADAGDLVSTIADVINLS
jgi:hypothetical protein